MRIQHNIAALNSYRQLGNNNNAVSKNLEKLSSGYKINRAGDDAAGLAISEKMRSQISGLQMAQKNANDGISLVQTAEGALTEVHSMLNRMVSLATQAANGTYDDDDRKKLQSEVDSLLDEIDRISEGTNFNGINLLDGTMSGAKVTLTKGLDATANNAAVTASTTVDFNGKTVDQLLGGTMTINGKTYTFFDSTSKDELYKTGPAENGIDLKDAAAASGADAIATAITTAVSGALKGSITVGEGADAKTFNVTAPTSATGVIKITATKAEQLDALRVTFQGTGKKLQIGDTADSFNQLGVSAGTMSVKGLGLEGLDISNIDSAAKAIDTINAAIDDVSTVRSNLGAVQNRLEHTINNLGVTTENLTSAESRIRDTDMAEEMMAYTKNSILVQSAQAMLAQANTIPQGVLQLLQ